MVNSTINDLLEFCPVCKGQSVGHGMGGVTPPVYVAPGHSASTAYGPCTHCNSLGRVLTDSGKTLLVFLQMTSAQQYQ
jgi:hypothetical protein